jgi:hypothetical protein
MFGYIISNREQINVDITKHQIQSFDILHKTYLNILVIENNKVLYINNIIVNASRYGHIQVLDWFKNSGYKFKYDEYAINYASRNGHIKVLEWFKNSGYEFKYDKLAINNASAFGQIQVLEWFKNSGYAFKYNKHALTTNFIKILKFYSITINIKKLIKWTSNIFIKTIKFKTHNKYLKGYQKN